MQEAPQQPLSLIIPVYNEAAMLEAFLESLQSHLAPLPVTPEILLIDDGSTDGSWGVLCGLCERFPGITAIRFTRNFGKEAAILAGLERCTGDAAIVMDADLQHPPSLLAQIDGHRALVARQ